MKFTKTAVAVAIAGIAAVPMIASADTTLSGLVQIQVQGNDADDDNTTPAVDEGNAGGPTVAAGDVFVQAAFSHELNSGLTGYANIRQDMNALSNNTTSDISDSIYVGIKGGFGDFRLGEIPLAVEYGQVANDIFDVGAEINGGMSYVGSFGPVGLIANFSPENNSDAVGLGAKFGFGGFSFGVGFEDRGAEGVPVLAAADSNTNFSAGVSFALAGASIAAHVWQQEGADATAANSDLDSISVKAGYGFGGVSASLTFSTLEGSAAGSGTDQEAIRLDLAYGLGGGLDVSTRITAASDNAPGGADQTDWRIQLAKSF